VSPWRNLVLTAPLLMAAGAPPDPPLSGRASPMAPTANPTMNLTIGSTPPATQDLHDSLRDQRGEALHALPTPDMTQVAPTGPGN
jgi:hypothetical protein